MRNRNKSVALYEATRRDILSCMETGNFDRARTVLKEYEDVVQNDVSLDDHSKALKTEIIAAYAVSL